MLLRCGSNTLDLTTPVVMGILNVTPDSFSDGGHFAAIDAAIARGEQMAAQGAGIIDVGGESTRPGAAEVSEADEIARVLPVIEALSARIAVPISIDTSKPGVMRAAVSAGAAMINDVRALRESGALAAAAAGNAAVCLMHMQGEPRSMQHDPQYSNVIAEVRDFLAVRLRECIEAGIAPDRIALDPGIGFGKRIQHNLDLLANLPALLSLGRPVVVGVSRKSLFQTLLNRSVDERLAGGLAVGTAAVLAGAGILRTHDVAETVDAVKVAAALRAAGYGIGG